MKLKFFLLFQIRAQELGPATNLSATVDVTVYINDINDNAPVFDQEMYVVDMPENITAGTKVAQVKFLPFIYLVLHMHHSLVTHRQVFINGKIMLSDQAHITGVQAYIPKWRSICFFP